jgi:hypothetical protein
MLKNLKVYMWRFCIIIFVLYFVFSFPSYFSLLLSPWSERYASHFTTRTGILTYAVIGFSA